MTTDEAEKLIDEILVKCKEIRLSKGTAYAGREDRLGNFKRCASLTGVSPAVALFIYASKHFDALSSYVRGDYKDSETIDGRIADMINYMFLFYALIKEESK